MAVAVNDNLDEFFDFARLEYDRSHCPSSDSCPQQHGPPLPPEGVAAMDWATHDSSTACPAHAFSLEDVCMQDAFDVSADHSGAQQWHLVDGPGSLSLSSPTSSSTATEAHVTDSANKLSRSSTSLTTSQHSIQSQTFRSTTVAPIPPSSASPHQRSAAVGLEDRTDVIESVDIAKESSFVLPVEASSISASSLDSKLATVAESRPSAPLRQASITNWKPASAKRKGPQSRIPLEAKQILEDEFAANPYPCSWEMDIIAHQANLDIQKVRNWFNNTRARKKYEDAESAILETTKEATRAVNPRLSSDSLEALDKHASQPPQPPLAVYLAQSYQEEAVELSAVQAAIDNGCLSEDGEFPEEDGSESRQGRRGSVITSVASSEGTTLTAYTISSSGSRSKISSFGRDRRRGRRRLAWKESPYSRQRVNGVNSAGEPQQDLPFFCTFCPRAFKTKYEWVRHEDSVHALRTTWICCDTKGASIQACPFCGQAHPDEIHMAGHKYQQCLSKPESQRTFYRRDHFVQHLHHVHFANVKHPSLRTGCQARLMAEAGQHFGCKELAMKWRRFGAPMKRDDPMLHCGFCGKRSKDWSERCEHIAEHLVAREVDRSVWWSERKENHLENLYSASPFESFRCRYCLKVFTDVQKMNDHSHCKVWSCRFLPSFDDVATENAGSPDFPSMKAHHCHLCGAGYRTFHAEHAQNHHRYRSCNQEFYTSEDAFLQHLHNFHGASQPALLQGHSAIEQSFMRNKGASFEPVEFNERWQPCLVSLGIRSLGPFDLDRAAPALPAPANEKRELAQAKKQSPTRKNGREEAQHAPRQRTESTMSKPEAHGPRFFRLSTLVPFLSSRIFYSQNGRTAETLKHDQSVLEELAWPHVSVLLMSAGLIGMAGARWAIKAERHAASGMVELALADEGD